MLERLPGTKAWRTSVLGLHSNRGIGEQAKREPRRSEQARTRFPKAKETSARPHFSLETGGLGRICVQECSKPGAMSAWVTSRHVENTNKSLVFLIALLRLYKKNRSKGWKLAQSVKGLPHDPEGLCFKI